MRGIDINQLPYYLNFCYSYLNLGLLAARHGIFKMEAGNNASRDLTSVCVDPIISGEKWTYGNVEYSIR